MCVFTYSVPALSFPGDNFKSSKSLITDTETVLSLGHLEKFNFNQVLELQTDRVISLKNPALE